ncbi:hypothetical protein STAN_6537 [Streptomyces sp. CBMAI 2042]|nr:hypothetical protein STAN_6537 [Streptomyces sp. CBMAI 2042]
MVRRQSVAAAPPRGGCAVRRRSSQAVPTRERPIIAGCPHPSKGASRRPVRGRTAHGPECAAAYARTSRRTFMRPSHGTGIILRGNSSYKFTHLSAVKDFPHYPAPHIVFGNSVTRRWLKPRESEMNDLGRWSWGASVHAMVRCGGAGCPESIGT